MPVVFNLHLWFIIYFLSLIVLMVFIVMLPGNNVHCTIVMCGNNVKSFCQLFYFMSRINDVRDNLCNV